MEWTFPVHTARKHFWLQASEFTPDRSRLHSTLNNSYGSHLTAGDVLGHLRGACCRALSQQQHRRGDAYTLLLKVRGGYRRRGKPSFDRSPTRSNPPSLLTSLPASLHSARQSLSSHPLSSIFLPLPTDPPLSLPPFCRALIVGLDEAKWAGTYKFAQAVLEYYDKVCSLLSSSPNAL